MNNDQRDRWAVAVLLFVDPGLHESGPDNRVEGAKHFLLFSGPTAEAVLTKAQDKAHEIEEQLVEIASWDATRTVRADLGPYLPTRFLGFEDIRWVDEPVGDGAIVFRSDTWDWMDSGQTGYDLQRRGWKGGPWCLAEVVANAEASGSREIEPREQICFLVYRATGARHAVVRAGELVNQRSALAGHPFRFCRLVEISEVDDPDLAEDAAELLYFTVTHPASRWRRFVRGRERLSIFG